MDRYPGIDIRVRAIENRFFGEKITVAGLVTGVDLAEQLGGEALGDRLLLPSAMLRHERDKFLDDMTLGRSKRRSACRCCRWTTTDTSSTRP